MVTLCKINPHIMGYYQNDIIKKNISEKRIANIKNYYEGCVGGGCLFTADLMLSFSLSLSLRWI